MLGKIEGLRLQPLEQSYLETRASGRFRLKIREFLGYKLATLSDAEILISWLMDEAKNGPYTMPQYREKAYQFFRSNKLEPFTPERIDRYIKSGKYRFEKKFFSNISKQLSPKAVKLFNSLLGDDPDVNDEKAEAADPDTNILLHHLKKDVAGVKLKHVAFEIKKLSVIRSIQIPVELFGNVSRKLLTKYYRRVMAARPSNILEFTPNARFAAMACFFYIRSQLLTDSATDLLIKLIHKMRSSAETHVKDKIVSEVKRVNGKFDILYLLADTALGNPLGVIEDEIYPKVSKEILQTLVVDLKNKGNRWYKTQVNNKINSLYSHAHRNTILNLLDVFTFQANCTEGRMLLEAVAFIKQNKDLTDIYYPKASIVPINDIISSSWKSMVIEKDELSTKTESSLNPLAVQPDIISDVLSRGENVLASSVLDNDEVTILPPTDTKKSESEESVNKINRLNYEVAVLELLREKLRCKSVWIEGAYRYRNPDEDLPSDWETCREACYLDLGLSLEGSDFVKKLKNELHLNLQNLNDTILQNDKVKIIDKKGSHIKITPLDAQSPPVYLDKLQREINRRWSTINLLDILKEADLRIDFTKQFHSVANREILDGDLLQKRLLLCLYALGSNTGLKRISAANDDATHSDLNYVKRRFINEDNVKAAIIDVVNEIIAIRDPDIWGESTTGCACDSTQVSSWDQNLMNEWHPRYKERGVMIYWHVDTKSAVIHSQIKTCLSSEVGAMLTGVLRHDTKMDMDKTYVDTHGQSTVGFGFSYGLDFDLLPRIKGINRQKLYYPTASHKSNYQNLDMILKSAINWQLIEENYDEYVKHVAALKTGTVDPDVLIKKFSSDNYNHPVYKTLIEIGNAVKTIFLCRYLSSEALRIEINESLNVVERLNGIMGFIFYGKLGELSTNINREQSLAVSCLHLLQVCMVYVNTLIIQEILSDPAWINKLTPEDKRALTPLIHAHINPYGLFPLDLYKRLAIEVIEKGIRNDRAKTYSSQTESEAVS
ncbi:MAG: Tn3 family transposase [Proteobacteria bacterium]|nr:Tn3 family transposase [Pseudomonadota bacterium]